MTFGGKWGEEGTNKLKLYNTCKFFSYNGLDFYQNVKRCFMDTSFKPRTLLLLVAFASYVSVSSAQSSGERSLTRVGAYYFDGWSGLTRGHLTEALVDSFPNRKPVWGWITSTPEVMEQQIASASDAGLSFFSFCWYYPSGNKSQFRSDPLNRALNLYLKAPNRDRLQFCLLVANHQGAEIGPSDWGAVSQAWLTLFKERGYLRVNNRPLLVFFSIKTLLTQFGGPPAVHRALDSLRTAAQDAGFAGVTIAACTSGDKAEVAQAQACGFDVLTGYNYHSAGFKPKSPVIPIDSLLAGSRRMWDRFQNVPLPYIPVVTLNWDPRPWASSNRSYAGSPRYEGFSSTSVFKGIQDARYWLDLNPNSTPPERIIIVYAWNEYGEGAWLTPSSAVTDNPLSGVKRALKK
jgi:hypothetical protein